QWLQTCDDVHGSRCRPMIASDNTSSSQLQGPHWVIDVNRHCIVPGSHGQRYFALSYVWGTGAESPGLCIATARELQENGALKARDGLPRLISDVMEFV